MARAPGSRRARLLDRRRAGQQQSEAQQCAQGLARGGARLDRHRRQQRADAARLYRAAVRELARRYRPRRLAADRLPAARLLGRARMRVPQHLSGALAISRRRAWASASPRARPCCGGAPISSAPAASRRSAREVAEDAAATKIVRGAGLKVRLVDRPFAQPLGHRSAAEVWNRQLRWARLRRASFFAYFLPEIVSGGVLPMIALACHRAGARPAADAERRRCSALLWYGGEMLLAAAAGWHVPALYPLYALTRDLLAAGAVRQRAARQRLRLARQRNAGRAHAAASRRGADAAAPSRVRAGWHAAACARCAPGIRAARLIA